MERRFTSSQPITMQTRQDGTRRIIGYGAVFHRADDPGTEFKLFPGLVEWIAPEAFDRAIKEKDDARGLFNHDPDNLLGRVSNGTLRLSTDQTGLRYEIDLNSDDADHTRVAAKIERGDLTGSSFAFVPEVVEFQEGHADEPDRRIIRGVRLLDTGPVTYPAYEASSAGLRHHTDLADVQQQWRTWKAGEDMGANLEACRLRMLATPIPGT